MSNRTQVGGTHYEDMEVQPITLIEEYKLSYHEGNVLKYVMRHESKNGVEDLEKALDYLRMLEDGRNSVKVYWFTKWLPINRHWFTKWVPTKCDVNDSVPHIPRFIITFLLCGRDDNGAYSLVRDVVNNLINKLE